MGGRFLVRRRGQRLFRPPPTPGAGEICFRGHLEDAAVLLGRGSLECPGHVRELPEGSQRRQLGGLIQESSRDVAAFQ